jgi:ligand-binding SRPBCC domain-containing protein
MVHIHITTFIQAPLQRVYDLARNLSVLKSSLQDTPAEVSSGAGGSLLATGDTLTFQSRNLGKTRTVTARVMEMDGSSHFTEEQVKGDLKSFRHAHHFKETDNGTIMIDLIECEGPRDFFGSMAGEGALRKFIERVAGKRIAQIRQYAESDKWKAVLTAQR